MSAPTPLAQGTLASIPLAHVVLSAHKRKLTGTLAVWPDEADRRGQDRVMLMSGVPVSARLLDPAQSLERGLLPLFQRRTAAYAFYDGDLVGEGEGVLTGNVHPLGLVAAALRGGVREDARDAVLSTYGDSALRLAAGLELGPYQLTSKEAAIVELVRASPAPAQALVVTSGDEKTALRVLYLLALSGGLEQARGSVTEGGMPSAASSAREPSRKFGVGRATPRGVQERRRKRGLDKPEPPPEPPATLSPELAERWREITRRIVEADDQNYFQVLGIPESPSTEAPRAAYFELAKLVHPDRLPAEFAPLRPYAERFFQQVTEAKEQLEDDEKRMKYITTVRGGGGTPAADRKLMAVLTAAHELDKATVLTNLGKWDEALEAIAEAKACDDTQLDTYALEAWVLYQLLGQDDRATVEGIVALCNRVLEQQSTGYHERALYTKGLCLKKQNQEDEAVEIFRRIAEKNPRHLDAAREVRLYEMRHRGAGKVAKPSADAGQPGKGGKGGKDEGGLLSKLFGSKKD